MTLGWLYVISTNLFMLDVFGWFKSRERHRNLAQWYEMNIAKKQILISILAAEALACFPCIAADLPPANPVPGQAWSDPVSGMDFCYCPPGSFKMGSGQDFKDKSDDQLPQHEVKISKGFWLGRTVVTQAQWEAQMHSNPAHFKGSHRPVESVDWNECSYYLYLLNQRFGKKVYRLPTEAEWEYACGAGTLEPPDLDLGSVAWYFSNSGKETHAVAQKQPNAWRLYDMLGNVRQWCLDFNAPYAPGAVVDPIGPPSGKARVNRGGSWACRAFRVHQTARWAYDPGFRDDDLGFRVVRIQTTP